MLLCIDMGNTNITLGCYKNDELLFVSRMYTAKQKSSDEYAIELLDIFNLYNVNPTDFSGCITPPSERNRPIVFCALSAVKNDDCTSKDRSP